jgi:hypothetical protein
LRSGGGASRNEGAYGKLAPRQRPAFVTMEYGQFPEDGWVIDNVFDALLPHPVTPHTPYTQDVDLGFRDPPGEVDEPGAALADDFLRDPLDVICQCRVVKDRNAQAVATRVLGRFGAAGLRLGPGAAQRVRPIGAKPAGTGHRPWTTQSSSNSTSSS